MNEKYIEIHGWCSQCAEADRLQPGHFACTFPLEGHERLSFSLEDGVWVAQIPVEMPSPAEAEALRAHQAQARARGLSGEPRAHSLVRRALRGDAAARQVIMLEIEIQRSHERLDTEHLLARIMGSLLTDDCSRDVMGCMLVLCARLGVNSDSVKDIARGVL